MLQRVNLAKLSRLIEYIRDCPNILADCMAVREVMVITKATLMI